MKIVFLIIAVPLLPGCGVMVSEITKTSPVDLPSMSPPNVGSRSLKISPGAGIIVGTRISAHLTVTPTRFSAEGPNIKAHLALSQSRTQ